MAPKPLFFIIRPGQEQITAAGQLLAEPGSMVPLIPVDLLPQWIVIKGVPSHLTPEDTVGMTNMGSFHKEKESYQLKFLRNEEEEEEVEQQGPMEDTDASTIYVSEPDETSPQHIPNTETRNASEIVAQSQAQPQQQPKLRPPQGLSSSRHNPLNSVPHAHPSPPSASASPAPPRLSIAKPKLSAPSTYCRHWCHYGTCRWGIECKFEHKMPTTLEGLCSVGLPDYPTWWRTATALAMGMSMGAKRQGKRRRQKKILPLPLHVESRMGLVGRRREEVEVEDADDEREREREKQKEKEKEDRKIAALTKDVTPREENLIEI